MKLLERESFLASLDTALVEASQGTGRLVLVSGEAGIGKTTLLEQFTNQHSHNVRVLWGACDSLFTPRPLGPLHDIANQIDGELPKLLASNAPRTAIFSAALNELQRSPAIVVFEDVHWADEATLDLLRFVGRRINQTSTLLVITYRDDELGSRHPLRRVLGNLASSTVIRRIPLPSLSKQAVQTLVGNREIDAAALHHQSGGNPFYVTEVLANPEKRIPASVRDAVLARVARLSGPGHAVLEAAAIIGQRVEPWLLAKVIGTKAQAVDEIMAVGVLLVQEESLIFRHELARKTILETISPPRRQVLHRTVLDGLRSNPTSRHDLARLVHHAEAAGDRKAILEYAPAAARQAALASAHRAAATLYALALRFIEDLEPPDRAALLDSYATECFLVGQHREGITARQKALELWQKAGNLLKQGENLAQQASLLIADGQNTNAESASQAAISILKQLPPSRELAHAYRIRATLFLVNRDCQEAIAWAEKALALAERFGDENIKSTAHNVIGTALLFVDYRRGCDYLENSLIHARTAKLEARAATAYANLGSGSGELYHFVRARRYLNEGITFTNEHDLDFYRLYMMAWLALTHLHLGHWDEAANVANELMLHHELSAISRIVGLVTVGRLRARRGDADAFPALDEALELATKTRTIQRLVPVYAARAEAAWLADDPARTGAEAGTAYDLALSKQHPWFTGELAFWRWRTGDSVEIPDWMAEPFALQIAGEWQAAADAWEALGCPYERARALADGNTEAQVAALRIFEQLGARQNADRLRRQLQAAAATKIPRQPRTSTRTNPFSLTNRQVEVLVLLIENLTNAEIAARLHISPKTVDHHVSAVLTRLKVQTRQEAADLARQHPNFSPPKEGTR